MSIQPSLSYPVQARAAGLPRHATRARSRTADAALASRPPRAWGLIAAATTSGIMWAAVTMSVRALIG